MRCLDLLFVVVLTLLFLMYVTSIAFKWPGWRSVVQSRDEKKRDGGRKAVVSGRRGQSVTWLSFIPGVTPSAGLWPLHAPGCAAPNGSAKTQKAVVCVCSLLLCDKTIPLPLYVFAGFSNLIVRLRVCLVPARSRHLPAWSCWSMLSSLLNSFISVLSYSSVHVAA